MPCAAFMCERKADCRDLSCPGHPAGAESYLDEEDRRALAHHRAMHANLYAPLRDEPVAAESEPWAWLDELVTRAKWAGIVAAGFLILFAVLGIAARVIPFP